MVQTAELPGNFSLVSDGENLVLTSSARRTGFNSLLFISLALYIIWQFGGLAFNLLSGHFRTWSGFWSILLVIIFLVLFVNVLVQFVRFLGGQRQVLRSDRETLSVTSIDFGKEWRTLSFAVADIEKMQFGEVGLSQYGSAMGLVFQAEGKKIKCMRGLTSLGAQQILQGLQQLGVQVLIDPGIKMAVEMDQSRAKSAFRFL
jgi:hypothetical protein